MTDPIVDTNVLLVASAGDPGSRFKDTHVPVGERRVILRWLKELHRDNGRCLVLDRGRKLYKEYTNKLTSQDYGLLVAMEKARTARYVTVAYDGDGRGVVPPGLSAVDASDKVLVAIALADRAEGGNSAIVNACDTDWHEQQEALEAHGLFVEQLVPEWAQKEYWRKHPEKAPKPAKASHGNGPR